MVSLTECRLPVDNTIDRVPFGARGSRGGAKIRQAFGERVRIKEIFLPVDRMTVASPSLPNPVSNFTGTVKSLLELLELPEEDEYGTLRPTDHAFKRAIDLLLNAYESLGERFPRGIASTDEEGGIRINWRQRQKDRRICLFCPANLEEKAYIYHQSGEEYASEESVSDDILTGWLQWFDRA